MKKRRRQGNRSERRILGVSFGCFVSLFQAFAMERENKLNNLEIFREKLMENLV